MLNWKIVGHSGTYTSTEVGGLVFECHPGRTYKDGTIQYSIWVYVPGADSREIITIEKIRGTLSDAQVEVEKLCFKIFADLKNAFREEK